LSGLLAVFAHPDDETFRCGGALTLLARQGVRVQILTTTRGQAGSCGDLPQCGPKSLGMVREAELRCACAALGLEPPILLDYQDGALARVSDAEAVNQIMAVVLELRPQVLLTWPPDGLSGHPDHVAVSRWTTLIYEQVARLAPEAPAALYHLVLPRSIADRLGLVHLQAIPDEAVTLTVDVTPVWKQKLAAIHCHRTQLGVSSIMAADKEQQRIFLGREYFRRVQTRTDWDFCLELGMAT
jgi:LmbE family N-acetylglucosaminyl deacetylase